MEGTLTLRGRVGTDLTTVKTKSGTLGIRFRLAVTQWRRTDQGGYEDLGARWYSVRAWGKLARYTLASIRKGDPVVVVGRPQAQAWTNHAGEILSDLLISAQIIGHDLNFGTTSFYKNGGQVPPLMDASPEPVSSDAPPAAADNPVDMDAEKHLAAAPSTPGMEHVASSATGQSSSALSQVRMETQATPIGSEFRTDTDTGGSIGSSASVAGAFSGKYNQDAAPEVAQPADAGGQTSPAKPKRTPKVKGAAEHGEAPLALSA